MILGNEVQVEEEEEDGEELFGDAMERYFRYNKMFLCGSDISENGPPIALICCS